MMSGSASSLGPIQVVRAIRSASRRRTAAGPSERVASSASSILIRSVATPMRRSTSATSGARWPSSCSASARRRSMRAAGSPGASIGIRGEVPAEAAAARDLAGEPLDLGLELVAGPGVVGGEAAAPGGLDRDDGPLEAAGEVAVVEAELAEELVEHHAGGGGLGGVALELDGLAGEAPGGGPLLEHAADLGRLEVDGAVGGEAEALEALGQLVAGEGHLAIGVLERLVATRARAARALGSTPAA